MLDRPAFLNVARSVIGRRWIGPPPEIARMGLAIAQATGQPEIVGRLLAARGVMAADAEAYLAPTLRALMPDPSGLRDMDAAAARLVAAVGKSERIAVFADYDVDGAASAALLADWLGRTGNAPTLYVPDRIEEGYGPNLPAMRRLAASHNLIVCVDCGTQGAEPIAAARAAGASVVVVDHHLADGPLPEAEAVVNPNRPDCRSGLGHLCAAGVVFLLLVAANRLMRARGLFRGPEPDLMAALDLVALATVADVAPLIGLNRAFVRQGLRVLSRRARPGLAALADAARLTAPPTARDLGFALGPRINAGGRIGTADLGVRLLTAATAAEATAIAARLDTLNTERRAIEAEVLAAAIVQAEARGADGPLVWAAGDGWHPGVVGIVASRLKERFSRPAVVIGMEGGEGKGSGRSVTGIDLGAPVSALAREGLLLKGGGHRMAAGLTVAREGLEAAMEALSERLARQGAGAGGPEDLALDGSLAPGGATLDLVEALEAAGPFGPANPAPRIAVAGAVLARVAPVGNGHLRMRLTGAGGTLEAVAFGAEAAGLAGPIEAAAREGARMHLAGRLEIDDWGGRRRPKLRVEDAAPASGGA